jgi:hypothetical protein
MKTTVSSMQSSINNEDFEATPYFAAVEFDANWLLKL